ncbi:MAG: type II toxin-antitoxin system VapC family toxin [Deltaproteobacteria bacterium]|nr:type II toxin-antitoxin system VapC family toxin [Deltaproteobacteria bacterium]
MIALDTNVLVRFLVDDDQIQADKAARLLRRAAHRRERLFVSDVVVCEMVWVLRSCYQVTREEIAATIESMLKTRQLLFASPDLLAHALHAYRSGQGDFADYVIRERARQAGCDRVATFDGALVREAGFVAP